MSKAAVDYASLVGNHVRMTRAATDEEIRAGNPPVIGMECLVAMVEDSSQECGCNGARLGHPKEAHPIDCVTIVAAEGIAFTVRPDQTWSFRIWSPAWQEELDRQQRHRREIEVSRASAEEDRRLSLKLHLETYHGVHFEKLGDDMVSMTRYHDHEHNNRVFTPAYRHPASEWSPRGRQA